MMMELLCQLGVLVWVSMWLWLFLLSSHSQMIPKSWHIQLHSHNALIRNYGESLFLCLLLSCVYSTVIKEAMNK